MFAMHSISISVYSDINAHTNTYTYKNTYQHTQTLTYNTCMHIENIHYENTFDTFIYYPVTVTPLIHLSSHPFISKLIHSCTVTALGTFYYLTFGPFLAYDQNKEPTILAYLQAERKRAMFSIISTFEFILKVFNLYIYVYLYGYVYVNRHEYEYESLWNQ